MRASGQRRRDPARAAAVIDQAPGLQSRRPSGCPLTDVFPPPFLLAAPGRPLPVWLADDQREGVQWWRLDGRPAHTFFPLPPDRPQGDIRLTILPAAGHLAHAREGTYLDPGRAGECVSIDAGPRGRPPRAAACPGVGGQTHWLARAMLCDIWKRTVRETRGSGDSEMRREVSRRVRDETTECRYAFACLTTGRCGDRPMCEVVGIHGRGSLKVKAFWNPTCRYRLLLGHTHLCRCPVHVALYQQREP